MHKFLNIYMYLLYVEQLNYSPFPKIHLSIKKHSTREGIPSKQYPFASYPQPPNKKKNDRIILTNHFSLFFPFPLCKLQALLQPSPPLQTKTQTPNKQHFLHGKTTQNQNNLSPFAHYHHHLPCHCIFCFMHHM